MRRVTGSAYRAAPSLREAPGGREELEAGVATAEELEATTGGADDEEEEGPGPSRRETL